MQKLCKNEQKQTLQTGSYRSLPSTSTVTKTKTQAIELKNTQIDLKELTVATPESTKEAISNDSISNTDAALRRKVFLNKKKSSTQINESLPEKTSKIIRLENERIGTKNDKIVSTKAPLTINVKHKFKL